ncbi:hypothetical protein NDU88_006065 [Pleurodeles waltl]|uniref:Uncharacterized protein n=1 Tax=Pleurodeles waltl TaxID=8319 RepID=A0AAV7LN02_PLEWA|nr:hypothetical protein NDU88_006065 [Pleurodeles waltl]
MGLGPALKEDPAGKGGVLIGLPEEGAGGAGIESGKPAVGQQESREGGRGGTAERKQEGPAKKERSAAGSVILLWAREHNRKQEVLVRKYKRTADRRAGKRGPSVLTRRSSSGD